DAEHIGIVEYAFLQIVPSCAAIDGLPRQVPGAGIDNIRVLGINGDGDKIPQRGMVLDGDMVLRRNALPGSAAITGTEDPVQSADHEDVMVARRHGQGADRLTVRSLQIAPRMSTVFGAKDAALGVVEQAPTCNINNGGIRGIKNNMVENVVLALAEMGEKCP